MARFDWTDMTTPTANSAAITIALPTGGAFLLQSALTAMDEKHQWSEGESEISDVAWDELQALLADLMKAIMTEAEAGMIPIGFVVPFASTTEPSGWLLCDGSQYLRVNYPLLYAVLASEFIVDANNFTTPDLDTKFLLGIGTTPIVGVGDTGGEAEVALTLAQLAAHSHLVDTVAAPGQPLDTIQTGAYGQPSNTVPTQETGDGDPHENVPPYLAMPYYIKAE